MSRSHPDIRESLGEERTHLIERIAELTIGSDAELDFDSDFADRGQVAGEKGENLTLAASLQRQLDLVDLALSRLDDETYGTCLDCGEQIGAERLEAMPAANRCINHAGTATRSP